MRDDLDELTQDLFPWEQAVAVFEQWMMPFVNDDIEDFALVDTLSGDLFTGSDESCVIGH